MHKILPGIKSTDGHRVGADIGTVSGVKCGKNVLDCDMVEQIDGLRAAMQAHVMKESKSTNNGC